METELIHDTRNNYLILYGKGKFDSGEAVTVFKDIKERANQTGVTRYLLMQPISYP